MHLLILGLVLVIGILVYYIVTTSSESGSPGDSAAKNGNKKSAKKHKAAGDLRKEDNVIFLPTEKTEVRDRTAGPKQPEE